MTKEDFLAGKPFKLSPANFAFSSYKYEGVIEGDGTISESNKFESNTFHCNVEKVTKTHIHVYTVLLDKVLNTKIPLSSLHVVNV